MLCCSDSTNPNILVLGPTSAVLQRRLHGAPLLALPAAPGRRQALHLLRRLPLPQVDLQTVVEQEQGCRREERRQKHHKMCDWLQHFIYSVYVCICLRWTITQA